MRRLARGVPRRGYERGTARLAAILAAFSGAVRGDEAMRQEMVDRMVGWLAHPARLDPYEVVVPEDVLRMVLPDWGEAVRDPTLRRLRANRFQKAGDGIDLLLEALAPDERGRRVPVARGSGGRTPRGPVGARGRGRRPARAAAASETSRWRAPSCARTRRR